MHSLCTTSSAHRAVHGIGKSLTHLGIQDTYAHGAIQRYLMREYGIDAFTLLKKIEEMLGENFNQRMNLLT